MSFLICPPLIPKTTTDVIFEADEGAILHSLDEKVLKELQEVRDYHKDSVVLGRMPTQEEPPSDEEVATDEGTSEDEDEEIEDVSEEDDMTGEDNEEGDEEGF